MSVKNQNQSPYRSRKKTQVKKNDSAIAYQNKDIASKVMAEEFKGKTFAVYGIDVPKIKRVGPTNLPAIEVNELRLDNLFELEDGSYAIVDYESRYAEENKNKYLGYIARIAQRLYNENGRFPLIRFIIIYTADVEKGATIPHLNMGCMTMKLEEAFLSDIDSKEIYDGIKHKMDHNISLVDEDLMRLIIYPLTFKGNQAKRKAINDTIELVDRIDEESASLFVYKCILAFTDKVIDRETAQEIRRRIGMMTQVEQIIEQEKIDAVNEAVEKAVKSEQAKAEQTMEQIAKNMFLDDDSIEKISRCVGLSMARLEEVIAPLKI